MSGWGGVKTLLILKSSTFESIKRVSRQARNAEREGFKGTERVAKKQKTFVWAEKLKKLKFSFFRGKRAKEEEKRKPRFRDLRQSRGRGETQGPETARSSAKVSTCRALHSAN